MMDRTSAKAFSDELERIVKEALAGATPNMSGSTTRPAVESTVPKKKPGGIPRWAAPVGIGLGALGIAGLAGLASRRVGKAGTRAGARFADTTRYEWEFGGKAGRGSADDYRRASNAHWSQRTQAERQAREASDAEYQARNAESQARRAEYQARKAEYEASDAEYQAERQARGAQQKARYQEADEARRKAQDEYWKKRGEEGKAQYKAREAYRQGGKLGGVEKHFQKTREEFIKEMDRAGRANQAASYDIPSRSDIGEAFEFYGLDPDVATRADVIKNHQQMVKKFHTDMAGGGSRENMSKANIMWERLKKISALHLIENNSSVLVKMALRMGII